MLDDHQLVTRIWQQLRQAGFKATPQRQATVNMLIANEDGHLSAEELYAKIAKDVPAISLATVYRTLEIMTELDLLSKVEFEDDGLIRYDLRREGQSHHFHHHLVCTQCGKVVEIHTDLLGDVERRVARQYHFQVDDHRLTFYGLCADCQRKNQLQTD